MSQALFDSLANLILCQLSQYAGKKDVRLMNVFFMTAVLQHYLSDGEIREPFLVCTILDFLSGTRTINSSSLQWRASHIRSNCSKLTLSVISWYKSLIVFGRMPVTLARSACVHLSSPSFVDNKILIIRRCSFRYKIAHIFIFMYHLLFYSGFCYILSNYNRYMQIYRSVATGKK